MYKYMHMPPQVYAYVFVDHPLATKDFIGKLLATRGEWIIIGYANDERGSWTNKLVTKS